MKKKKPKKILSFKFATEKAKNALVILIFLKSLKLRYIAARFLQLWQAHPLGKQGIQVIKKKLNTLNQTKLHQESELFVLYCYLLQILSELI